MNIYFKKVNAIKHEPISLYVILYKDEQMFHLKSKCMNTNLKALNNYIHISGIQSSLLNTASKSSH